MGLFTDFWDRFDYEHVPFDFSGPTKSSPTTDWKIFDPSKSLGAFRNHGLGKTGKAAKAQHSVRNTAALEKLAGPRTKVAARTHQLQSAQSNHGTAVGAAASVVKAVAVSSNKFQTNALIMNDIEARLGDIIAKHCPPWPTGGVLVSFHVLVSAQHDSGRTLVYEGPVSFVRTGANSRDAYRKFNPPYPTISATKGKVVPAWKEKSDLEKKWGKGTERMLGFGWVTRAY